MHMFRMSLQFLEACFKTFFKKFEILSPNRHLQIRRRKLSERFLASKKHVFWHLRLQEAPLVNIDSCPSMTRRGELVINEHRFSFATATSTFLAWPVRQQCSNAIVIQWLIQNLIETWISAAKQQICFSLRESVAVFFFSDITLFKWS